MKSLRLFGIGLLAGLVVAASACSNELAYSVSEAQLEEAFIEPLEASGLDYSVEEVCRLPRRTSGSSWHLTVDFDIEAETSQVADVLGATVDIIQGDDDYMNVQQYRGEPRRGWNGLLERENGRTTLGLTKNNVDMGGELPSVGWLTLCAGYDE